LALRLGIEAREEKPEEAENLEEQKEPESPLPRSLYFDSLSTSNSQHTERSQRSLVEVYDALRKNLTEPFDKPRALSLITKFRGCSFNEAEKIFKVFVDEGKIGLYGKGLGFWT